jgi:hypothetical protein
MQRVSDQKILLDLAPELRQLLDSSGLSIRDLVRREGFDLAIDVLPEELPGLDEHGRERGIGTALMGTAALSLSLGAAAAIVILALSKFYSDREQAPVLVETYIEKAETAPDGSQRIRLVKDAVFRSPERVDSPSEIEVKLNLTDGVTVRFLTGDQAAD